MNTAHNIPRIAIILINLNGYEDTSACLTSLKSITYPHAVVVVVDNGSTDNSASRLRAEFPEAMHIQSAENLGFTGGNNLGIEYALRSRFDHVLLLNNDTIVTPGFLEPLVARLESDSSVAAVSGKILYGPAAKKGRSNVIWYAGSYQRWHMAFNHRGLDEIDTGQHDTPSVVAYACGCLMLMRGGIIHQIGMLSDDYFIYWDEADWCERARVAGYQSYYEPRSIIYHNFRSSNLGMETPFHNYLQFRNAFIYAQKYYSGLKRLRFWSFYPLVVLYRLLQDLRVKNHSGAKAIIWGVLDFFRGYRGGQGLREHGLIKS